MRQGEDVPVSAHLLERNTGGANGDTGKSCTWGNRTPWRGRGRLKWTAGHAAEGTWDLPLVVGVLLKAGTLRLIRRAHSQLGVRACRSSSNEKAANKSRLV